MVLQPRIHRLRLQSQHREHRLMHPPQRLPTHEPLHRLQPERVLSTGQPPHTPPRAHTTPPPPTSPSSPRHNGSPPTNRSSASSPSAYSRLASDRLRPRPR